MVGNVVLAGAGGAQTNADFTLPEVESKRGVDLLDEHFGGIGAGWAGTIVFQADQGVDHPGVRSGSEPATATCPSPTGWRLLPGSSPPPR